jgi:hypothetical protein
MLCALHWPPEMKQLWRRERTGDDGRQRCSLVGGVMVWFPVRGGAGTQWSNQQQPSRDRWISRSQNAHKVLTKIVGSNSPNFTKKSWTFVWTRPLSKSGLTRFIYKLEMGPRQMPHLEGSQTAACARLFCTRHATHNPLFAFHVRRMHMPK